MTPCLHRMLPLVVLLLPALALARQAPPPAMDDGRCDTFSRLHRFAEESKSMCDEGRQVKVGPLTAQIHDMIAGFSSQVVSQGLGNACHAIKMQVWDLIAQ